MSALGTLLFAANSFVFLVIGHIFMIRLGEAKGSLRLAKRCITMAAFSAAAAFYINFTAQLVYEPADPQNFLVTQMFVASNMLAMLVLAFLASFAVFATYSGRGRRLLILLIFVIALIPTAYLVMTYNQIIVTPALTDVPESYALATPPLMMILFALCGIPLGVIPVVAFSRTLIMARRKGDTALGHSVVMMFSALLLNEAVYLVFVFGIDISRLVALAVWIPVELFLLLAVLRITSPVRTKA